MPPEETQVRLAEKQKGLSQHRRGVLGAGGMGPIPHTQIDANHFVPRQPGGGGAAAGDSWG